MKKKSSGYIIYAVFALVLILMITMALSMFNSSPPTDINYTQVVGYFQRGEVKEYSLDLGTGELKITKMADGVVLETDTQTEDEATENPDSLLGGGLFDLPQTETAKKDAPLITYQVPNLGLFWNDVEPYILEYNEANPDDIIQGNVIPASELPAWLSYIPVILLVAMLAFFWISMMRQAKGGGAGGASGFGKAKARNGQDGRKVTFEDVAGADEEKQELVEVVDFLREPNKFNALGARIPKGVLLVGPPGTGKTLLARAVAGEADVEFFSISGSDFVEMFVGVGASRVRDLFDQAKKSAPSVIFIDEIDAVGRQRGAGMGGGHDEREQTLNQLLVEMDGFGANSGVIVMAATNRSDILDPALLRPGRFDRQVYVGRPDVKGREEILKVHCRNKPLAPDVDLRSVARGTAGFTGADLENVINEAALLAARRNLKSITMAEIEESTIKVVMGPEKRSRVITQKDLEITAYHEVGHAIAVYCSPTQDPVHEISIISRGMAAGYTMPRAVEDRLHVTKQYMKEDLVVFMGGRVAEEIIFKDVSTGASNDLERATDMARDMVTRYGFSEKVGPVVYKEDEGSVFLGRDYGRSHQISDAMATEIDEEVKRILQDAYKRTTEILTEHLDKLHEISKRLLETEKMDGETFVKLMEPTPEPTPSTDFFTPTPPPTDFANTVSNSPI